uniref:Stc1 domain-containing protein n=1 Tax=Macrostomum lignano TaxID=282301 RepID=A0A1I8F699_9PLAT
TVRVKPVGASLSAAAGGAAATVRQLTTPPSTWRRRLQLNAVCSFRARSRIPWTPRQQKSVLPFESRELDANNPEQQAALSAWASPTVRTRQAAAAAVPQSDNAEFARTGSASNGDSGRPLPVRPCQNVCHVESRTWVTCSEAIASGGIDGCTLAPESSGARCRACRKSRRDALAAGAAPRRRLPVRSERRATPKQWVAAGVIIADNQPVDSDGASRKQREQVLFAMSSDGRPNRCAATWLDLAHCFFSGPQPRIVLAGRKLSPPNCCPSTGRALYRDCWDGQYSGL